MSGHAIAVRVYYEDTDFSGNVYHAAYLKFCERGRTEFLRAVGVHHAELAREGVAFAVRRMTIDFLLPARIDDLLTVETRIVGVSGARLDLAQAVRRGDDRLFEAQVTVAAIRLDGRPTRLPSALRALVAG